MTLRCSNCKSLGLEITSQSYTERTAFESYECEDCGATGSVSHDDAIGTTLKGSIERENQIHL